MTWWMVTTCVCAGWLCGAAMAFWRSERTLARVRKEVDHIHSHIISMEMHQREHGRKINTLMGQAVFFKATRRVWS